MEKVKFDEAAIIKAAQAAVKAQQAQMITEAVRREFNERINQVVRDVVDGMDQSIMASVKKEIQKSLKTRLPDMVAVIVDDMYLST